MCNKIEFISDFDPFPQLEALNLSFNNIKVNDIPFLSQLKRLNNLDLSSNNLTGLPDNLA
jgi:Leucine-rich repeat (LRR) protein